MDYIIHGILQARIYWSGLPCLLPGNLPNPEIKPASPAAPALHTDFFTDEPLGKPLMLGPCNTPFSTPNSYTAIRLASLRVGQMNLGSMTQPLTYCLFLYTSLLGTFQINGVI